MKLISYALALGSMFCASAAGGLVITGSTLDCLGGKSYHPAGVDVFVFADSLQLEHLIDEVVKADDNSILDRFGRLVRFVKASKPLAHTKSDHNGSFRAEMAASEKLIVIGYMETEDDPLYWMYSYANATGQTHVSVTLDYCKKGN